MYSVLRVSHGLSPLLQEGDILLEINGESVTTKRDLDVPDDCTNATVKLIRNRNELTVRVPTVATDDLKTDRVVYWCGLAVHRPHHAVLQQIKKLPSEVYIVHCARGSPGDQYGVTSTFFITDVNEQPTPTLENFWEVISTIPDNTYVKLRVVTFDNLPCALSIKTNYHYFPTSQRIRDKATGNWESVGLT
jgi:S1-C subfamily serine protease